MKRNRFRETGQRVEIVAWNGYLDGSPPATRTADLASPHFAARKADASRASQTLPDVLLIFRMADSQNTPPVRGGNLLRAGADLLWTLGCAAAFGVLFQYLGVPAPYMLGSMLGIWALSASVRRLRGHFQIGRGFHKCVILGLGVLIGAMFGPESIAQMSAWMLTLGGTIVTTVTATALGYWYLVVQRGYEPTLALFCAMPGGQAEIIAMSRDLLDKDYVVALCHLTRVVVVFCTVPLAMALVMGEEAVRESNENLMRLPGLTDVSPATLLLFFGIAVAGYLIARWLRAPMPHLMGPVFLSMFLHLAGTVDIPRISEFVLLAQLTIGGAVGARLGQVEPRVLRGYLRDALVLVGMMMCVFVSVAALMSVFTGFVFFDVMLAYVPGGLYEISLLSLLFGFDVVFIAIHHATRMLFILLSLPWLLKLLSRD